MKQNDQGFIVALDPMEVIIVGTNFNGSHYGGAAKQSYQNFGLKMGFSEGLCNQTYAFPTLDEEMRQRSREGLLHSVVLLNDCARHFPQVTFYLTKVGEGIAGYSTEFMSEILQGLEPNIVKV